MSRIKARTSVAVLLPALNEELTVGHTIRQFAEHLPFAEFWVIDNGSSDATAKVATRTIADLGCTGGVIWVPHRGKGNAVRAGFRRVEADFYVVVDADTTYPAGEVVGLLDICTSGQADMVVGDRISLGSYKKLVLESFTVLAMRL